MAEKPTAASFLATLRDSTVLIEGNKTTEDHWGVAEVYFFRSIRLPEEINLKTVTAKMIPEGDITIEAHPSKDKEPADEPLIVPIILVP
ncbi:hypothetical protein PRIPAC_84213 [Pristionchus pacificus]|uniref:SHSP domain-containing protein n=1 Tax=Pristionchus pacificus TaxID=54126 RepID=A0A2A6BGV9_PRIPA|nr:hypothetical protein PRIPAC_84213 [Pristionchus pacificus]|eukprot:PDM65061.1 hypothetical protein PRIPAC_53310 [Pristionchus pacificus]